MKIFDIAKNPIIRIIALAVILYLGLFSNKESPESLGNRLSKEALENDLNEVKKKSNFIFTNVVYAKKQINDGTLTKIEISDLSIGNGDRISCGDIATISYSVYDVAGNNLDKATKEVIFDKSSDNILEKYLEGMRILGAREIIAPRNFQTKDLQLKQYQEVAKGNIKYKISLKDFKKSNNNNCKDNEKTK